MGFLIVMNWCNKYAQKCFGECQNRILIQNTNQREGVLPKHISIVKSFCVYLLSCFVKKEKEMKRIHTLFYAFLSLLGPNYSSFGWACKLG